MKKISVILLLALSLLLFGCSDTQIEAAEPAPQPTPAATAMVEIALSDVRISELMASNKTSYPGPMADYPDWLELVNTGSDDQSLAGITIERSGKSYELPDISLAAGERLLLLCSEETVDGMYSTGFKLPGEGFPIKLMQGEHCVQQLLVPALDSDISCLINEDNSLSLSDYPSPGFESYEEYQAQLECYSPLMISEVMVYNRWHMPQEDEYYDWVELKNNSADSILLSDYYISDKSTELKRYRLPETKLGSGEYIVVFFDELCEDGSRAPFGLDAEKDELYVSNESATVLDAAALRGIPYGGSYGRMDGEKGFFYFSDASPKKANTGGMRSISAQPLALSRDGVFNNVQSVSVELGGSNLFYTLDGSLPTASSTAYTGPFSVAESCVVRVVSIEEGKLPSMPLNLSYIINENHSLPVFSLAADPEEMFGKGGIYKKPSEDLRISGAAMFYEDNESFSINCDMALHGATSKLNQSKKSFNLYFRDAQNGRLNYDLFENGVTEFSKIILRADQESVYSSLIRDNLMHQLAIKSFPQLPAQDYKHCVLYINGEYRGVYNIREAHNDTHYSQHYGVDEELVSQHKGTWDETGFNEYYRFILHNDMSKDENYRYAAEHVDIDSIIGWAIVQAYSGNIDLNPDNMRFYYLQDSQKLVYALVDLDLGMFDLYAYEVPFSANYTFGKLLSCLSDNEQFRTQLFSEMSRVFHSTMSDENVHQLIDELAAEIRPEMERNGQRWDMPIEQWEKMVSKLHRYVNGRASFVIDSITSRLPISKSSYKELFGDIVE